MDKFTFILAVFLLVGATKINGDDESLHQPDELPPITPPDILIEPIFEKGIPPADQINGRPLTPAEGCGYSPMGVPRIVGGGPARNGAFPWIALLGYKFKVTLPQGEFDAYMFRCGGSLISSRHVITAAHCVMPDLSFARLGEHDIRHMYDGQHQDIPIVESKPHTEYNKTLKKDDIAVLVLGDDAVFTDRVRPICLLMDERVQSYSSVLENTNGFVAGWGNTKEGGTGSPYLKHVQVPTVELPECRKIYSRTTSNYAELITDANVCAGTKVGESSCQGDSGGPLMMPMNNGDRTFRFYLIGSVSWSYGCARVPTVYMRTQYYGDWIKSMLN